MFNVGGLRLIMALFIINKKLWVYFGNLWPFLSAEKGGADLGITSVVLVKLFPPTTLLPLNFFFSLHLHPTYLSITPLCATHRKQICFLSCHVPMYLYPPISSYLPTYLRICTYLSQAIYLPWYLYIPISSYLPTNVSVPTYLKLSTYLAICT